jgi:serine/threonine-protein kinase RsbW
MSDAMSTSDVPNVTLQLSSDERSLPVVGNLLSGVAACLQLDELAANDLGTAVAEACKNVVIHAYEGSQGPLELEVHTGPDLLEVVVRDDGIGIRPHLGERTRPHNGIGLPIVHLLTKQLVYTNLDGGGTELRMRFQLPGVQELRAAPAPVPPVDFRELELSRFSATLSPAPLARTVLAPLVAALVIRASCGEAAARELWPALHGLAAALGEEPLVLEGELREQGGLELMLGPLPTAALTNLAGPLRAGTAERSSWALLELPGAAAAP